MNAPDSTAAGFLVLDREPGKPWWCEHTGAIWRTWEEAAAERDRLAPESEGLEMVVARLVIDDSRGDQ